MAYNQFIDLLIEKSAYTFITNATIEKLGSCFWPLLDVTFKQQLRMQQKRNAFWYFAQYLRRCIKAKNYYALYDLWKYFSNDSQKMWKNYPVRWLKYKVDQIL